MQRLSKMEEREHTTLMRILFGMESPTPVSDDQGVVKFFDQTLNESQQDAVRFALASREVALIHGPPGVSWPSGFSVEALLTARRQAKHIP